MENKELFETDLLGIAELDHLRSLDVRGLDKSLIERFIYCGSQGDAGQAVNQQELIIHPYPTMTTWWLAQMIMLIIAHVITAILTW